MTDNFSEGMHSELEAKEKATNERKYLEWLKEVDWSELDTKDVVLWNGEHWRVKYKMCGTSVTTNTRYLITKKRVCDDGTYKKISSVVDRTDLTLVYRYSGHG